MEEIVNINNNDSISELLDKDIKEAKYLLAEHLKNRRMIDNEIKSVEDVIKRKEKAKSMYFGEKQKKIKKEKKENIELSPAL